MFFRMLIETKNSMKKLLMLLAAVTALGAVGQVWGMEDSEDNEKIEEEIVDEGEALSDDDLHREIKSIYFMVINTENNTQTLLTIYKMEMKNLPAVMRPAIISTSYHHECFKEASSVMISYPMSQKCFGDIKKLQPCKKICSYCFGFDGLKLVSPCETSEIDTEKAFFVKNYAVINDAPDAQQLSRNHLDYPYVRNYEFYRKTIIEPLTDDVNLPIFGEAKNGKIYHYNGEDANKRLNFRKEKFLKSAYLIKGFIDNNNEMVGPDFTCVGEVTTDIQDKATFTQDGNFKEKLDAKFDNIFFKKLDEQHKRDIMNIDICLISKDDAEKSVTLYELSRAIPIPVKIALLKNATLINHLIVPFEDENTKNLESFYVFPVISAKTFESIKNALSLSLFAEEICSLRENEFRIPVKSPHGLFEGQKADNYDCMDEDGLKKLLQEALVSNENNDVYCQENIINPIKRQDKPLLAWDDKKNLYLYTKENNAYNYHEKLKLMMQATFTKTSGDEKKEKGFFLMKERIKAQDGRFAPIGKIENNKVEWDKKFNVASNFEKELKNINDSDLLNIVKTKFEEEEIKLKQPNVENNNKIEGRIDQEIKIEKIEEKIDKIEKNEKPKLDTKQLGIEYKTKKLVIKQFNRNIEQFRKEKLKKEQEEPKREQDEKKQQEEKEKLETQQKENPTLCSFVLSLVKGFFGGLVLGATQAYVNNNTSYFKKHENISDILFGGIGHGVLAYHCLSNIKAKPTTTRLINDSTILTIPVLVSTAAGYVCGRYPSKGLKSYVKSII